MKMNTKSRPSRRVTARLAVGLIGVGLGVGLATGLSQTANAQSFLYKAKQALGGVLANPNGTKGTSEPASPASSASSTSSTSGSTQDGRSTSTALAAFSQDTVTEALKQALAKAVPVVAANLGAVNGFNDDPVAHIPLPDTVSNVQTLLNAAGMGSYGEEIELQMNRAAEATMNEAGDILLDAVAAMSIGDAKAIVDGADDAGTRYLRDTAGANIAARLKPHISDALAKTGAIGQYDAMLGEYKSLPLVPDVNTSLTDFATQKALDGLFYYIARQEADIRNDPARWSTDILKNVFAAVK